MNTHSHASRLALLGAAVMLVCAGAAPVSAQRPSGNADTVDGKHAVGAGASKKARKNKLVATNGKGLLPGNIIKKAPDASRLDGRDSSDFATVQRPFAFAWDAQVSPSRTASLTGTPTTILSVPVETQDECGGGETVHSYHVEFTGWLLGGENAFMEASMAIDGTGHAFGPGTVVGSAYSGVAASRMLQLTPGTHTVNLVASKSGADALSLVDGFLAVTDLGYACGVPLRQAPTVVGSGPGGL